MQIQINNQELADRRGIPESIKDTLAFSLKYAIEATANSESSGAKIVAKGLLSACNGYRYQFDVCDLASLDSITCEHLLHVFLLRHYGAEPQYLILNGQAVFEMIAEKWGFKD